MGAFIWKLDENERERRDRRQWLRPRAGRPLERLVMAQRLEGSRFVVWQFYRFAAGGSRRSPMACCCSIRSTPNN